MTVSSATGGYLPPLPPPAPGPLEGQALFEFFQQFFVNLTGLPGTLFFPRWQSEPPNLPAFGTDWAAFGITKRSTSTFAYVRHVPGVNGPTPVSGYNEYQRHEELDILVSFYGPDADTYAALVRDGVQITQNLEVLELNSMGLIETLDLLTVPELVKERWLYRVDLTVRIRRLIVRQYAILDVVTSGVVINNEQYLTTIPVDTGPARLAGSIVEGLDSVLASAT
jgi:hypothetical protein